ncbi:hypothetical protein HDV03_004985 [Kappamyces sp. JEL0829]|nr:hypothetical protein HDV03_004985 [Kappamyces sp. JEL0829]
MTTALRDEFTYKPKITKEQFFAKGFAERKCLFLCDVIRLCKTLHNDLAREYKAAGGAAKKRTPLAPLDGKLNVEPRGSMRLNLSSPSPDKLQSTFGDTAPSPRLLPSSSIAPPSKYMSDTFWRETIQTLNPIVPTPPAPQEKTASPLDMERFHYKQSADDSLLHYQPEDLGSASSQLANPSLRHTPYLSSDVVSISDAGKPEEPAMTISDYYPDSVPSGQAQTRYFHRGNEDYDRRTPSPSSSLRFRSSSSPRASHSPERTHKPTSPSRTPTKETFHESSRPPLYNQTASPTRSIPARDGMDGSYKNGDRAKRPASADGAAPGARTEAAAADHFVAASRDAPVSAPACPTASSNTEAAVLQKELEVSKMEQKELLKVGVCSAAVYCQELQFVRKRVEKLEDLVVSLQTQFSMRGTASSPSPVPPLALQDQSPRSQHSNPVHTAPALSFSADPAQPAPALFRQSIASNGTESSTVV